MELFTKHLTFQPFFWTFLRSHFEYTDRVEYLYTWYRVGTNKDGSGANTSFVTEIMYTKYDLML